MDKISECYKKCDLKLLKKLTLVIPTYNRNYYLSRCLWYHAHFPFGQIIVADSSPEEKKIINRDTVSKIRKQFNANILYLEYKPETDKYGCDISKKWIDAEKHAETEYTQVCTDKQFIIPSASCECIRFLTENKDYANAEGMGVLLFKNIFGKIIYRYWNGGNSLEQEKPIDRLKYSEHQGNDQFCIQRTEIIKYICDIIGKYELHDIRFSETATETIKAICGKAYRYKNFIGYIRDISENNTSNHIKKSNESSDYRYPHHSEYPFEYRLKQTLSLEKAYGESIATAGNSISLSLDDEKTINEFCKDILNIRYKERRSQNKINEILSSNAAKIWYVLPCSLQLTTIRTANKISGKKIHLNPKISHNLADDKTKIVEELIRNTEKNYADDKPIL